MKWAVFVDRPYYPTLHDTYKTLKEAQDDAKNLLLEEDSEDGAHDNTIYICEILQCIPFKGYY